MGNDKGQVGAVASEPPPLVEFLDAGCTFAEVPGFNVELLIDRIDEPREPWKWAAWYREQAALMLAGEPTEMDRVSTRPRPPHTQADVCMHVWAAECLEDPVLARRVRRWRG